MDWRDLETLVAHCVRSKYQACSDDHQRRTFCEQMKVADQQLRDTAYQNPSYALPRIGEAYALKYHLQRADNVYTAVTHIHNVHPLSPNLQVLDIGSGTGGSSMAVALWLAHSFSHAPDDFKVYGVEPEAEMKQTASYLLEKFSNQLTVSYSRLNASNVRLSHARTVSSLQECANSETTVRFDLILFSYTFSLQEAAEQVISLEYIKNVTTLLQSNGLMIFLTPTKPVAKRGFIELVSLGLTEIGMRKLELDIAQGYNPGITSFAPEKRPIPIVELRREINEECRRLNMEPVYGEDPTWDDPYYGFYCIADAFSW